LLEYKWVSGYPQNKLKTSYLLLAASLDPLLGVASTEYLKYFMWNTLYVDSLCGTLPKISGSLSLIFPRGTTASPIEKKDMMAWSGEGGGANERKDKQ
jgi:hypothetical protein